MSPFCPPLYGRIHSLFNLFETFPRCWSMHKTISWVHFSADRVRGSAQSCQTGEAGLLHGSDHHVWGWDRQRLEWLLQLHRLAAVHQRHPGSLWLCSVCLRCSGVAGICNMLNYEWYKYLCFRINSQIKFQLSITLLLL